jgi:hypothetical protein
MATVGDELDEQLEARTRLAFDAVGRRARRVAIGRGIRSAVHGKPVGG